VEHDGVPFRKGFVDMVHYGILGTEPFGPGFGSLGRRQEDAVGHSAAYAQQPTVDVAQGKEILEALARLMRNMKVLLFPVVVQEGFRLQRADQVREGQIDRFHRFFSLGSSRVGQSADPRGANWHPRVGEVDDGLLTLSSRSWHCSWSGNPS